jgi:spore maturation protein CgeB
VDPAGYFPVPRSAKYYDLGYLGTYSADRQPALERLLLEPARQWREGSFCVAGSQYPASLEWPDNVARVEHLVPAAHRKFYNRQRCTLNVTRADMVESGYSPSVRLFEAAACGVPIITDEWPGLHEFFTPDREILIARSTQEALAYVRDVDAAVLEEVATRARQRVLAQHTADHRAGELEAYVWRAVGELNAPRRDSRAPADRGATVQM